MIHILIVSHGNLGQALIEAAEMIVGPIEGLSAVALLPGETPEGFDAKLDAAFEAITGEETLILIDLFGGTPYNVVARRVIEDHVECLTGANLPMLLELVMARDGASLPDLAQEIAQAGQESVKNLGPMLKGGAL
jgi:mannose/fructose/sorbose-specific phosphotransferase system IIA component